MQLDQASHLLDELTGVLQPAKDRAAHLPTDQLVAVEADLAVLDAAGARLGDIVQERGPAQD